MSDESNWRIEVTSADYFLHERKRADIEQRRPVIRKGSDLVGPGIGAEATQITDYNDQLATFNGYYSSVPGALYAPNATDSFIGYTIMDATLGGKQVFTSLVSGNEFSRVFRRSPSDASSVAFGAWLSGTEAPAVAYLDTSNPDQSNHDTGLEVGVSTWMQLPAIRFRGAPDTYGRSNTVLSILRPGTYTGHLMVRTAENTFLDHLVIEFPWEDGSTTDHMYVVPTGQGVMIPLNFHSTGTQGYLRVTAVLGDLEDHSVPSAHGKIERLHVTRIGD